MIVVSSWVSSPPFPA